MKTHRCFHCKLVVDLWPLTLAISSIINEATASIDRCIVANHPDDSVQPQQAQSVNLVTYEGLLDSRLVRPIAKITIRDCVDEQNEELGSERCPVEAESRHGPRILSVIKCLVPLLLCASNLVVVVVVQIIEKQRRDEAVDCFEGLAAILHDVARFRSIIG